MRQVKTPRERMQEVLDTLGISANEFERRCGLGSGFVARLTRNITRSSRQKIKAVFPDINMDYISINSGKPFEDAKETMPTMKERVMQFCKVMEISEKEFCRNAGLASTFVSNMSDNIRRSSLEQIINAYPMLSIEWLQMGQGQMISKQKQVIKNEGKTATRIKEIIAYLGITKTLFERETGISLANINQSKNMTHKQALKITERYPHVSLMWLMYGRGEMMNTIPKDIKLIPLVGQRSYKTFKVDNEEYFASLKTIPSLTGSVAFEVAGDAMDDNSYYGYMNGDIVICEEAKELSIKEYDFVIVHKEGIFLRRIKQAGDTLTLHALNKTYQDVKIQRKDVKKIYAVLQKLSSQKR